MDGKNKDGTPIIGYNDTWSNARGYRKIYLGHSCDSWIIGDIEEAKKFIKQLKTIIKLVEKDETVIINGESDE